MRSAYVLKVGGAWHLTAVREEKILPVHVLIIGIQNENIRFCSVSLPAILGVIIDNCNDSFYSGILIAF